MTWLGLWIFAVASVAVIVSAGYTAGALLDWALDRGTWWPVPAVVLGWLPLVAVGWLAVLTETPLGGWLGVVT